MPNQDCFSSAAQGSSNLGQGIRLGNFDRLAPPHQISRPALSIRTEGSQLRFACPYHKHSPNEEPKQRSCVYPGFKTIARLKEHLYRHHTQLRCLRCNKIFGNNDAALDEHQAARVPCTFRECYRDYDDGLDQDQRSRLKKRERISETKTDEDKWRDIYQTLFPGEVAVPTPYLNDTPSPELDNCRRYFQDHADRVVEHSLCAVLRGLLSEPAQHQVKKLVHDVHQQLFDEFHALQNEDDRSSCTSRASTPMSASPRTPLSFEENPPTPAADSEAHMSKKRRVDDTEPRQPQFDETMGGEAYLSNGHAPYQDYPPPQIRVSQAFSPESQSYEAFMEGYSITQLDLNGNLSLPGQSVHDAAFIPDPEPDPIPPTSTFTMSDALISDSPDPWELDLTLFAS